MLGLIISDPRCRKAAREALQAQLNVLDLPLSGFTEAESPVQDAGDAAFLRCASAALLCPGVPLPMDALMPRLRPDQPLFANVLRRHLFLQLSLAPYFRPGRRLRRCGGGVLVGDDLLILPVSPEDTVDALLPPGVWTELNGRCHTGRMRAMRSLNDTPLLVRAGALLPVGVNDRDPNADDADRLTLHWFQPGESAECVLADGTRYTAHLTPDGAAVTAATDKPFHLIIHQDGEMRLVR